MDLYVLKINVEEGKLDNIIGQILLSIKDNPDISYRSKEELLNLYKNSYISFVLTGDEVVAWILRIPYTENVQEISAGWTREEHRNSKVKDLLLNKVLNLCEYTFTVTFKKAPAFDLIDNYGFRKTDLWKIVEMTKGEFLDKRSNVLRMKSIKVGKRYQKPWYLIYQRKS